MLSLKLINLSNPPSALPIIHSLKIFRHVRYELLVQISRTCKLHLTKHPGESVVKHVGRGMPGPQQVWSPAGEYSIEKWYSAANECSVRCARMNCACVHSAYVRVPAINGIRKRGLTFSWAEKSGRMMKEGVYRIPSRCCWCPGRGKSRLRKPDWSPERNNKVITVTKHDNECFETIIKAMQN